MAIVFHHIIATVEAVAFLFSQFFRSFFLSLLLFNVVQHYVRRTSYIRLQIQITRIVCAFHKIRMPFSIELNILFLLPDSISHANVWCLVEQKFYYWHLYDQFIFSPSLRIFCPLSLSLTTLRIYASNCCPRFTFYHKFVTREHIMQDCTILTFYSLL